MRCAFPGCDHDSSQNVAPKVSFHRLPDEESLRAAWMEALGQTDWMPDPGSVVCSEHILVMDLLGTSTENPLPVLCRICFTTEYKMYSMTCFKMLNEAYESLTGVLTAEEEHLPRYLCGQCAGRLMNYARFRRRSLRAHSMMIDIVRTHGQLSVVVRYTQLEQNLDDSSAWLLSRWRCMQGIIKSESENVLFKILSEYSITMDLIRSELQNHFPFKSDPADISNEEHFEFDIEDSDDANKQTDAKVDESPEDVKFIVDQSHIHGEDGTTDVAIDEFKTENEELNNEEDHSVCDGIIESSDMINLTVKVENSEVIDTDSPSCEHTASQASEGAEVLDDLTQLEGLAAKTMKTRRVVNEVKIDEQQTPEADGPSTDDKLRCEICHYQTDSDIQLVEHLKVHGATNNVLICDICNRSFCYRRSLIRHLLIHNVKPYSCDVCNKMFRLKCNLRKHQLLHSSEKPYSCDVCNKIFTLKCNLKAHLMRHLGVKPHSCDVCNRRFMHKGTLRTHQLMHSNEKTFSCVVCNKVFREKGNLKAHLTSHLDVKPHSCDVCNKRFMHKGSLRTHQLMHSNEKPFSCDVCNKVFRQKGNLKTHQLIHSDEKPFSCDVCNKVFRVKGNLKTHQSIHSDKKRFSCHVCNKVFRTKENLKRHLLIHSNEKPFSCDVCNKVFRQKVTLKTHQSIHSGEKPFSCDVCKKVFKAKYNLNRHLSIHANDKLFSCDICNKSFNQKRYLRTHLSSIHMYQ